MASPRKMPSVASANGKRRPERCDGCLCRRSAAPAAGTAAIRARFIRTWNDRPKSRRLACVSIGAPEPAEKPGTKSQAFSVTRRLPVAAVTGILLATPIFRRFWYPTLRLAQLADGPQPFTLLGQDIVLWQRPDGTPAALEDKCPPEERVYEAAAE